MSKIIILIPIIIIGLFSTVSADVLSNRIIMQDIGDWRIIDSDMGSGVYNYPGLGSIEQERYYGLYEIENPISDSGTTRFGVTVTKPKSKSPEYIFDKKRGTYHDFHIIYKIIGHQTDSNFFDLLWVSGEYLIEIGPGTIQEQSEHSLDLAEDLIIEYGNKYPSDVKIRDPCNQPGLRRETSYCSAYDEFREQKVNDDSCLSNYECNSNLCLNLECVNNNIWTKFKKWLFGIIGN